MAGVLRCFCAGLRSGVPICSGGACADDSNEKSGQKYERNPVADVKKRCRLGHAKEKGLEFKTIEDDAQIFEGIQKGNGDSASV